MRQTLSVVILTRNEEKNILSCIESAKWADEIIVIDDNSTDGTVAIAKRYNAKILVRSLDGNFSAQRNAGNDMAVCDWILQMDADERITEGLKKKIIGILENGAEYTAFRFKRLNYFCGKPLSHGGEDLHMPLRLFKRNKARFTGDNIPEVLDVDGTIGSLDEVMEHYNFSSISHYVATQDFYSDLEAKELYDRKGLISKRRLKAALTVGVVKLFLKVYIKRKGYKDGMHGLIFAGLSAWRRFLIYSKYWEMRKEDYDKGAK